MTPDAELAREAASIALEGIRALVKLIQKLRYAPQEYRTLVLRLKQEERPLYLLKEDQIPGLNISHDLADSLDRLRELIDGFHGFLEFSVVRPTRPKWVNRCRWVWFERETKKYKQSLDEEIAHVKDIIRVDTFTETTLARGEAQVNEACRKKDVATAEEGIGRLCKGQDQTLSAVSDLTVWISHALVNFRDLEKLNVKIPPRREWRLTRTIGQEVNGDHASPCLSCCCQCHVSMRLQVSGSSDSAYIKTGSPGGSFGNCDVPGCSDPKTEYWLAAIEVPQETFSVLDGLRIASQSDDDPSISYPRDAGSSTAVTGGDLRWLNEKYQTKEWRPTDVHPVTHQSALAIAINYCRLKIAAWLIEKGADPHQKDYMGRTALDHFRFLKLTGVLKPVEDAFMNDVLDMDGVIRGNKLTPLHRFALRRYPKGLEPKLTEHKNILNASDLFGRSPLFWAVCSNNIHAVRTLLEHGADLCTTDSGKHNVFHVCVWVRCNDIAKVLLEARSIQIANGTIRPDLDPLNSPDEQGNRPLHQALSYSRFELIGMYVEAQCDVASLGWRRRTILHAIAIQASTGIADKFKIEDLVCIDPDAQDDLGLTAEHYLLYADFRRSCRQKALWVETCVALMRPDGDAFLRKEFGDLWTCRDMFDDEQEPGVVEPNEETKTSSRPSQAMVLYDPLRSIWQLFSDVRTYRHATAAAVARDQERPDSWQAGEVHAVPEA